MTTPTQPAEGLPEPAFRLTWRNGAYRVSEPNIGSTDCYTADQMRAYAREAIATAVPAEECEHNWRRGYGEPPYCSKCGAKEEAASVPVEKLREFARDWHEDLRASDMSVRYDRKKSQKKRLRELESLIQQEIDNG